MKYGEYNLIPGKTKVRVFDAKCEKDLGIWIYSHREKFGFSKQETFYTPVFHQGKKIIHGYACWWIPISVFRQIKSKIKTERRAKEKA
jgi:hypothetical protein